MIYKTLYRKLKIEQHEHHQKPGMNAGSTEPIFTCSQWQNTYIDKH